MISFPRILFPVDLSEQCRAAAPFVKALATCFHSDVTLLHVVEVPPAWYGASGEAAFGAWVDMPELVEARRNELAAFRADTLGEVSVQPCIQSGDPAAIIARVARQKQVSLIMMPTHGYGPFRGLLMGSVTAKVLHDAECPVWTATHPADMVVPPEQEWRQILCAIGAEPAKDIPLLHWAAQFASEQRACLRLVHAVPGFDEGQFNCQEDPLRDFVFNVARERIAKLQEQAGTSLNVTVEAGRTGHVVRELAIRQLADLVVIGRGVIQKPLGRLRSNAYAIVRDAPCPVVSV
ncbi:MAG: universal stress protein [Bryobacteraceae bacterium]|jgi:nucleotide-binding universal stress UspA family protein